MKARQQNIQSCFNKLAAFPLVELSRMKPTQMLAGMREVTEKQKRLRKAAKTPETLRKYLQARPILVVAGPDDTLYIVDHHHLALALQREGFQFAPVEILHDYSGLSPKAFRRKMQAQKLFYPYDETGKEHALKDLPQTLDGLRDDPYRSLAWYVRHEGGFKKSKTPFAEFAWARFFRQRIPPEDVARSFEDACRTALALSRDKSASALPGYIGKKMSARAVAAVSI